MSSSQGTPTKLVIACAKAAMVLFVLLAHTRTNRGLACGSGFQTHSETISWQNPDVEYLLAESVTFMSRIAT